MSNLPIQPRILRASEAPKYLGMCRAVFDQTVRPYVNEFPIGTRGVGFDRLELDQWADAYIAAHSIDKRSKTEPASTLYDNPQSRRKKRGPVMAGWAATTTSYKPPTSEEFHTLVDQLMGRSADKKDRRRKKQENRKPQTEE